MTSDVLILFVVILVLVISALDVLFTIRMIGLLVKIKSYLERKDNVINGV